MFASIPLLAQHHISNMSGMGQAKPEIPVQGDIGKEETDNAQEADLQENMTLPTCPE